jgi:hypothetical protein
MVTTLILLTDMEFPEEMPELRTPEYPSDYPSTSDKEVIAEYFGHEYVPTDEEKEEDKPKHRRKRGRFGQRKKLWESESSEAGTSSHGTVQTG